MGSQIFSKRARVYCMLTSCQGLPIFRFSAQLEHLLRDNAGGVKDKPSQVELKRRTIGRPCLMLADEGLDGGACG